MSQALVVYELTHHDGTELLSCAIKYPTFIAMRNRTRFYPNLGDVLNLRPD